MTQPVCFARLQLFGGTYSPAVFGGEIPRTNYDSIINALLTVFVCMSGENWNDVWAESAHALGSWTAVYYVVLVFISNFVLLNLLIAVVLGCLACTVQVCGT